MAIELTRPIAALCEGLADQNFLVKLIEKRPEIPKFDVLAADGASNFGRLLRALTGDRHGFSQLRGILIVADSAAQPRGTFRSIRDQISAVGGYPVPNRLSEIAPQTAGHPAVSVTLLPGDSTAGALETLCVADILGRHPWVDACLTTYLQCDKIEAHSWSAEKLAKARYHCLVAALNEDDPSRAVSYAFRDDDPVIDVTAACFDTVAQRLRSFAEQLGVT